MCNARLRRNSQWVHVSNDRIVLFWSTHTECECSSEPVPMFLLTGGNCTASLPVFGTGRQGIAVHFPNVKMAIQLCQSTHLGPHGPNRASLMNPMYSIARTRQCPRKSCSPRQPMAAYMWNGLQPVTSFTLIPNPKRRGATGGREAVCTGGGPRGET